MSAVEAGQMSAVEAGQMSAAETGQMLRQDDCLLLRRVSGSGAVWRLPQCSWLAPDGGRSLKEGGGGTPPPPRNTVFEVPGEDSRRGGEDRPQ